MSSLFIIGNGFDIAHGIPTAYKEFRNWLLEQYPDSLLFRETTMSFEEYAQLSIDEFATETLVYAMDHSYIYCDRGHFILESRSKSYNLG